MKNIILALCLVFFAMPALAVDTELNNDEQLQKTETVKVGNFNYTVVADSVDKNAQETIHTQVQSNQEMPIRPRWEDTASVDVANIRHQDTINRPKWAKPLAIVAEIGSLGFIPVASTMKDNDEAIKANNEQYMTYMQYKKRFDDELTQCETLFNTPIDRHGCYMNVKMATQSNLNGIAQNRELANQTALQKRQVALQKKQLGQQVYNNYLSNEQNRLIREQNNIISTPRTYTATTTKVGNFTYTTVNGY